MVKDLPANAETQVEWVQSLGREDLLQKEMATHSSILAWEIPWTEDPDWLQSVGSQRIRHHGVHVVPEIGPSCLPFHIFF